MILNFQDTEVQRICVPSLYFEVGAMAIMSMLSNRFCLSPQLNFLEGSSDGLDIIALKALVYNSLVYPQSTSKSFLT